MVCTVNAISFVYGGSSLVLICEGDGYEDNLYATSVQGSGVSEAFIAVWKCLEQV